MSETTSTTTRAVVLDWRHAPTGPPAPCVFGDGPTVCRSPVQGVPCHKACAETWITTHATGPADLAALIAAHTPRTPRGGA